MSDPTVIQTKVFAAIIELLGEKSLSIADKTRLIGEGGGGLYATGPKPSKTTIEHAAYVKNDEKTK